MDRSSFDATEPILDEVAELADQLLNSEQLASLRAALARLSQVVGPHRAVNLTLTVDVFDPDRSHALPLLRTGLSTSGGDATYRTSGDSTPQRYVVDGEVQVVPHDRCPRCYGTWDFKFQHPVCEGCGATLGRDVKILLDTDVCPHCEQGKVSMSAPACQRCGHQVDPRLVVWG